VPVTQPKGDIVPILRLVNRPNTRDVYDAVMARIDIDTQHPLGLIMHGASEVDGVMQIAQVWDSEEYARSFEQDTLEPTLRSLGVEPEGTVTMIELHHLVTP
jgi:hypothetical protein